MDFVLWKGTDADIPPGWSRAMPLREATTTVKAHRSRSKRGKVFQVKQYERTVPIHDATPLEDKIISKILARHPKNVLAIIPSVTVMNNKDFGVAFRKRQPQYNITQGELRRVQAFYDEADNSIVVNRQNTKGYWRSVLDHEIGHAAYDNSINKDWWAGQYLDPHKNFDKFTEYSKEDNDPSEGYAESYMAYFSSSGRTAAKTNPRYKEVFDGVKFVFDKAKKGAWFQKDYKTGHTNEQARVLVPLLLRESTTTVKTHTSHSKTGKLFTVRQYDRTTAEREAIQQYSSSDYAIYSAIFRHGVKPSKDPDEGISPKRYKEYMAKSKALDYAIANSIANQSTIVYRRLGKDMNDVATELTPGTVFEDPTYVSTSTSQHTKTGLFGEKGNVLFRINIPKGFHALELGSGAIHQFEKEILLPRNSKFVVTRNKKIGKTYLVDLNLTEAFEPEKHPRAPAGSKQGGEFVHAGTADTQGTLWVNPENTHGSVPRRGRILASYTDTDGYEVMIIGGVAKGLEYPIPGKRRRYGVFNIYAPDKSFVKAGYWMAFPEASWNIDDKTWSKMSWEQKAAMEVKHQATAYKSLKDQYDEWVTHRKGKIHEATTTVKAHKSHSKKGKIFQVKQHERKLIKVSVETDDLRSILLEQYVNGEMKRLLKIYDLGNVLKERPLTVSIVGPGTEGLEDGGGDFNPVTLGDNKFGGHIRIGMPKSMYGSQSVRFRIGGDTYLTDASRSGMFRHELGHYLSWANHNYEDGPFASAVSEHMKSEGFDPSKSAHRKQWFKTNISEYGSVNYQEAFAEAFAAYTHKDYGKKFKLPSGIEATLHALLHKEKKVAEAKTTVKAHTSKSKKGKRFRVKQHEREVSELPTPTDPWANWVSAVKMPDGKVYSGESIADHTTAIDKAFKATHPNVTASTSLEAFEKFYADLYATQKMGVRGFHPRGQPEYFVSAEELGKWEKKYRINTTTPNMSGLLRRIQEFIEATTTVHAHKAKSKKGKIYQVKQYERKLKWTKPNADEWNAEAKDGTYVIYRQDKESYALNFRPGGQDKFDDNRPETGYYRTLERAQAAAEKKTAPRPKNKQEAWMNSLSEKENDSVGQYSTELANPINYFLQYGKSGGGGYTVAELKSHMKNIDSAIAKYTTTKDFTAWRGMTMSEASPSWLKTGKVVTPDKGYASTSLDRSWAISFIDMSITDSPKKRTPVLFKISIPKGSHAAPIYVMTEGGDSGDEREVLLGRASSFKLTKVTKTDLKDNIGQSMGQGYVVEATYVPRKSKR